MKRSRRMNDTYRTGDLQSDTKEKQKDTNEKKDG